MRRLSLEIFGGMSALIPAVLPQVFTILNERCDKRHINLAKSRKSNTVSLSFQCPFNNQRVIRKPLTI